MLDLEQDFSRAYTSNVQLKKPEGREESICMTKKVSPSTRIQEENCFCHSTLFRCETNCKQPEELLILWSTLTKITMRLRRRKRFEKTFFRSLSFGLTRFRSKIMRERERERRRREETCKETHLQTQSVLKDTFTSAATEVTSLDVKLDMVSSCFSRLHL